MELEKKIRVMNRYLIESRIFYYSGDGMRYDFDELQLTIHPTWNDHRNLSNVQYDLYKKEYLEASNELTNATEAENRLYLDVENETHLYIALNMCKEAKNPLIWPGKTYRDPSKELNL